MSGLDFTVRSMPGQRLDLSALTADRLDGLNELEIATLNISTTKDKIHVGDVFAIRAGDVSHIRLSGLTDKCDKVGAAMSRGDITVEGDSGAYFGANMKGGRLRLSGSCGSYAASSLSGGQIEISGNAGDYAGGPYPGETRGMRGGFFHIRGNAGNSAGDRFRRGQMIIGGRAGDYLGSRMIAGTIAVVSGTGKRPGYGMRRGSLILGARPLSLLPTFVDCGEIDLGVLGLMKRALAAEDAGYAIPSTRVRRFAGDMASLGKGEILIAA